MEDVAERGRGRGRAGRGAHGQRRWQHSNEISILSWSCHQPWADTERLDRECSLSLCRILFSCNFLFQFTVLWAYFCSLQCKYICCAYAALTCLAKDKKINVSTACVCICKYFCACEQSEKFPPIWTILVLWQSTLKMRVLFSMPDSGCKSLILIKVLVAVFDFAGCMRYFAVWVYVFCE